MRPRMFLSGIETFGHDNFLKGSFSESPIVKYSGVHRVFYFLMLALKMPHTPSHPLLNTCRGRL